MTKIIEVIVTPTGETKIETKGFAGASCREATKALQAALGAVSGERLTDEFYQQVDQGQILQEGQQ